MQSSILHGLNKMEGFLLRLPAYYFLSVILPSGEEASPAVATVIKKRKDTAGTAALTKEKKKEQSSRM
jgi:hypothetical protein